MLKIIDKKSQYNTIHKQLILKKSHRKLMNILKIKADIQI